MFVLIPTQILCVLGFSGVCTAHALCFLRRNSMLEYVKQVIVNILLVLIPLLVIPLCIFYNFVMLDGGFSCVPTTHVWIHDHVHNGCFHIQMDFSFDDVYILFLDSFQSFIVVCVCHCDLFLLGYISHPFASFVYFQAINPLLPLCFMLFLNCHWSA